VPGLMPRIPRQSGTVSRALLSMWCRMCCYGDEQSKHSNCCHIQASSLGSAQAWEKLPESWGQPGWVNSV